MTMVAIQILQAQVKRAVKSLNSNKHLHAELMPLLLAGKYLFIVRVEAGQMSMPILTQISRYVLFQRTILLDKPISLQ